MDSLGQPITDAIMQLTNGTCTRPVGRAVMHLCDGQACPTQADNMYVPPPGAPNTLHAWYTGQVHSPRDFRNVAAISHVLANEVDSARKALYK